MTVDRHGEIVAESIAVYDRPDRVTFEVSQIFLEQWELEPGGWFPPVRFRFEKHDYDGGWNLVMKRLEVS